MLHMNEVCMTYGDFQALNGINLDVHDGELVVLLGANGAGKSTIFRTISGLEKTTAGDIWFADRQISGWKPDKIVRTGLVQCPEGRKLFPHMSVMKNLIMGGYVLRKKQQAIQASIEEVFQLFPVLQDKKNLSAGSLSGGQQQMLAIGRALMARPKLLMLDEPSLGLAPLVVQQMFETIKMINQKGTMILLAEQNANAALQIANRGYVIEGGSIVTQGSRQELLENDAIRKAYIGA
ncbi:ABC transporter ATP-binding protein [Tuberibacillus sp. Marseille-P3662]|uniref:ABC transporter ATP-binding protein n=1 Tax=Tuberibacillus sp. Marseille-P3662 TaxID=1965358 RepID=UPI000A1C919D|nr:ABC transporter ATP-binding protein [Tuberibacillus sp. Marseille-P3662]